MRPNYRIERTGYGWLFHTGETSTMVPFGFNPQNDVDPIALHQLDELYHGDHIDAEFLAYTQKGAVAFTPTHQIPITSAGIYLMRVRVLGSTELPMEGGETYTLHTVQSDQVQFVRIRWLDEVYKGTRTTPYVLVEHAIAVQSDREASLIAEAFRKAHEIDF